MAGIDPYVKSMLHMDALVDSSMVPLTVTANGDAVISTATQKWGTGAANCKNGSINVAYNASLRVVGDFCFDCQFKIPEITYGQTVAFLNQSGFYSGVAIWLENYSGDPYLRMQLDGSDLSAIYLDFAAYDDGVWHHLEIDGSGNTIYVFVGGALIGTYVIADPWDTDTYATTDDWKIGESSYDVETIIDEFRFSTTYRHTSAFTPPTEAYSIESGLVKLLLHMNGANNSPDFIDSSNAAHTVVAAGDAKQTTVWHQLGSAAGEFDAATDYLSIDDVTHWEIFNKPFTVHFWFYPVSMTGDQKIFSQYLDVGNYMSFTYNHTAKRLIFTIWKDGKQKILLSAEVDLSLNESVHIALCGRW